MPDSATLLCAVGRLSEQKNFGLMLDALALIEDASWCLLLVGEGEERQRLERHAVELGMADRIRFLGRRSDVPCIMQASDILLMSSSWEGFPYVVVEALANGLPIVATDVGGVREGVIDGVTGKLVVPGDAKQFATALRVLMDDASGRAGLGRQGRVLFENRFRDDAMFALIDEEIESALAH